MRLIDADAEIQKLEERLNVEMKTLEIYKDHNNVSYESYVYHASLGRISHIKQKIAFLESLKTAYDVEKAVEELGKSDLYIDQEKCITVEDAISLVKGMVQS